MRFEMKYIEFSEKQRPVLLAALKEAVDFWERWSPPSRWKTRLQRVVNKASQDCAFTTDEVLLIYETILGVPTLDEVYEEILHICHDAVGEMV
jgi:hypothetical protein